MLPPVSVFHYLELKIRLSFSETKWLSQWDKNFFYPSLNSVSAKLPLKTRILRAKNIRSMASVIYKKVGARVEYSDCFYHHPLRESQSSGIESGKNKEEVFNVYT